MAKNLIKVLVFILVIGIAYVGWNIFINKTFCITRYEITSKKIKNSFKGVLIADLHDRQYGENNKNLIDAVRSKNPDVIFLAGDIVNYNTSDFSKLKTLLTEFSEIAPTYYGFGNHEYSLKINDKFTVLDEIKNMNNVKVIEYGVEKTEINGNVIKIGSFSIDKYSWERYGTEYFKLFEDPESFFILMSHYPWVIPDLYPETSTDVVLCGHAHGGHVHLWNDIGLFVPSEGYFLPYTSGIHEVSDKTTEIVTRGIGDHTVIPRLNNQPEMVVINFNVAED